MSPAIKVLLASAGTALAVSGWAVGSLALALKVGKAMEIVDEAEAEKSALDEEAGDRLSSDFYNHLKKRIKDIEAKVECPHPVEDCEAQSWYTTSESGPDPVYMTGVFGMVMHLNDDHRWSRERIADWLDTLDLDLEVHQDPPPAPEPHPALASALDAAVYFLPLTSLPIPALSDPDHDKATCPVCSFSPTITSIPKEMS